MVENTYVYIVCDGNERPMRAFKEKFVAYEFGCLHWGRERFVGDAWWENEIGGQCSGMIRTMVLLG